MFTTLIILQLTQSLTVPKPLFLQQDTSKSTLAQGLEQFEATFADFSNRLDSSLSRIFSEISSLNDLNRDVANSVIGSDIDELEHKQFIIAQNIKKIKKTLAADDKCSFEGTCEDCAAVEDCVWCGEEGKCVKGDSDGPLSEKCVSFTYKVCPKNDCSRFSTCYLCLSDNTCEWCASTLKCIQINSKSNNCLDLEYYNSNALGRSNCPISESFSKTLNFLPSGAYDRLKNSLERLYEEFSACESLINLLEQAQAEINQSFQTSKDLTLTQAAFEPTLAGLDQRVKDTQIEEIKNEEEEQVNDAQKYAGLMMDDAEVVIEEDTDEVMNEVMDGGEGVVVQIHDVGTGFEQKFESINANIVKIDSYLKINGEDD